jgi:hypothetical protein
VVLDIRQIMLVSTYIVNPLSGDQKPRPEPLAKAGRVEMHSEVVALAGETAGQSVEDGYVIPS